VLDAEVLDAAIRSKVLEKRLRALLGRFGPW
jgi:hypothetical protein